MLAQEASLLLQAHSWKAPGSRLEKQGDWSVEGQLPAEEGGWHRGREGGLAGWIVCAPASIWGWPAAAGAWRARCKDWHDIRWLTEHVPAAPAVKRLEAAWQQQQLHSGAQQAQQQPSQANVMRTQLRQSMLGNSPDLI